MIPQPDIRPITEGTYRLFQDYWLTHRGVVFHVPKGFIHDGASVPRFAWSLTGIRPDGLLRAGALIHDILYHYKGTLPKRWVRPYRPFTREEADNLFYELNLRSGMNKARCWIAWKAVRWFGWQAWLKHHDG